MSIGGAPPGSPANWTKCWTGKDPATRRSPAPLGELRVSTRRIYVLLAKYRLERTVLTLLSRRGAGRSKRLAENVEVSIAATLREKWMVLERRKLARRPIPALSWYAVGPWGRPKSGICSLISVIEATPARIVTWRASSLRGAAAAPLRRSA